MKENYIQQEISLLQQDFVLPKKWPILPITWLYFSMIILLIVIDQWIKIYVKLHFFPGEIVPVFNWFYITYTENNGMAFGIEPFGEHSIGKIILTLIRIGLVAFVGVYFFRIIQQKKRWTLLIAVALIFSGALGNIIDNAFYDYIFPPSPFFPQRNYGFLLGSVVDMFQFNLFFPQFVPYIGGMDVFPAIFNFADACISTGIGIVLIFERAILFEEEKPKKIIV